MPLFLATYRPVLAGRSFGGHQLSRAAQAGTSRSRHLRPAVLAPSRFAATRTCAAASPLSASPLSTAPACPPATSWMSCARRTPAAMLQHPISCRSSTLRMTPPMPTWSWSMSTVCRWPSFCIAWTATRSPVTRPLAIADALGQALHLRPYSNGVLHLTLSPPTCSSTTRAM